MTRLILLSYVITFRQLRAQIIAHRDVDGRVKLKEHLGSIRAGNVDHRPVVRTLPQGTYMIQLKTSQGSEFITLLHQ
jgi:hypothetical protein